MTPIFSRSRFVMSNSACLNGGAAVKSGDSLKNPSHWKFDTDCFYFT